MYLEGYQAYLLSLDSPFFLFFSGEEYSDYYKLSTTTIMANTEENRNTIAGNGASTGRIMIDVITSFSNGEDLLQFRINNSTKLNKVFKIYVDRRSINDPVKFIYYNRQADDYKHLEINTEITPAMIGMGERHQFL